MTYIQVQIFHNKAHMINKKNPLTLKREKNSNQLTFSSYRCKIYFTETPFCFNVLCTNEALSWQKSNVLRWAQHIHSWFQQLIIHVIIKTRKITIFLNTNTSIHCQTLSMTVPTDYKQRMLAQPHLSGWFFNFQSLWYRTNHYDCVNS